MPAAPDPNNLSDEALLLQYRASGNSRWIGLLLQRYTVLLLGVAMKYLKDKTAAQDAVQQVFLKALTHLPPGEIQNFKGWLYILTRNHCLQTLRDKTYLAPDEVLATISADADRTEELLLRDATLSQMEEALTHLPAGQQQCITLFYLKKRSYQQIMEVTGFSFADVKSYIQNGKRNLKLTLLKRTSPNRPQ